MFLTIQLILLTAFTHGAFIREPEVSIYGYEEFGSLDLSDQADFIAGTLTTTLGTHKNTIFYSADRHHGVAFLTSHPGVQHDAVPFRLPCLNLIRPPMFAKSMADCYNPLGHPKSEKYFVPANEDEQVPPKQHPRGTFFEPYY